MARISIDSFAMAVAHACAERSTCMRRHVGCVLLNDKRHIIATGYNGVAAGLPHCNEKHACAGANSPSGTNLDDCRAIHAEQNALLQCKNIYEIETCYTTTAPCITCTKLLLNTSCKRIVYLHDYPDAEKSAELWKSSGRQWTKFDSII